MFHVKYNFISVVFAGTHCEDYLECSSNPCQNFGTCLQATSGYVCQCESAYTGVHCDTVR